MMAALLENLLEKDFKDIFTPIDSDEFKARTRPAPFPKVGDVINARYASKWQYVNVLSEPEWKKTNWWMRIKKGTYPNVHYAWVYYDIQYDNWVIGNDKLFN